MIPMIGLVGASGSGKTTLVTGVIAYLRERGYQLGAIKHHGHGGAAQRGDQGKDSERLRGAGADPVALCHDEGVDLWVGGQGNHWTPRAVAGAFMAGLDLVVVEGFKNAALNKIEVVGAGKEPIFPKHGRLLGVAGVEGAGQKAAQEAGLDWFDASDVAGVSEFILQKMDKPVPDARTLSIKVDGHEMDINPFVQMIIANTVRGMIAGLKGGDVDGSLELRID